MGATAAKMTMDATVWFAKNRSDLNPAIALQLATELGTVAEKEQWVAPETVVDEDAPKSNEEIQAFLENSGELFDSVTRSTGYPEELASILSSVANFMGWKVRS